MHSLISEHDLADELGLSVWTLRKWRKRSYGPAAHKLGKRVVYRRDDVQSFLAAGLAPVGE